MWSVDDMSASVIFWQLHLRVMNAWTHQHDIAINLCKTTLWQFISAVNYSVYIKDTHGMLVIKYVIIYKAILVWWCDMAQCFLGQNWIRGAIDVNWLVACWIIVHCTHVNKLHYNLNSNITGAFHENAVANWQPLNLSFNLQKISSVFFSSGWPKNVKYHSLWYYFQIAYALYWI